jgi:hypothetical protein
MPLEGILIELLNKNTSQLPDWKFRELIVEKINEIATVLNNEINDKQIKKDMDEEAERIAKEKIEANNNGNSSAA